jgi:CSLREA domain-containing protein
MIRFVACFCIAFAMLVSAHAVSAANYTVTKTADTNDGTCDADCSLREAIAAANGTADNDNILFALPFFSSPQVITLGGSELVVANNGSLSIYGPGANLLTISGNNASRILVSGANVVVNIHNLRFTAGNGAGATNTGRGGAIYNVGGTMVITNSILTGNSAANGGALNNAASASPNPVVPANLTLINCIVSNNSSTSSGAAMQNFSTSQLHLRNTTVNNNTSSGTGIASAFQANGMVTITNSTFSGNSAPAGTGGGVYYNGTTGLVITNSTLAGNSSNVGGGGLHRTGTTAIANVRNSIIADNAGAATTPDVLGAITSQGNNIVENVGTSTGWVMSDQQNVDPLLAPLGFYGGFGMTHYLLSTSPAINMGNNCVLDLSCGVANPPVAVTTDERGVGRPFGATVDIGAVEASSTYVATLPSAEVNDPYTFTLVPLNGGFTYSVSNGSFGGLMLTSGTSTTLAGTPAVAGAFNATVLMTGGTGMASQNYRINILADSTVVSVTGRVLTSTGEPVAKAYVSLVGLNGQIFRGFTNPFGYFRIGGIPAGFNATVVVNKKGIIVEQQIIVISDVIDNLEIRALP